MSLCPKVSETLVDTGCMLTMPSHVLLLTHNSRLSLILEQKKYVALKFDRKLEAHCMKLWVGFQILAFPIFIQL